MTTMYRIRQNTEMLRGCAVVHEIVASVPNPCGAATRFEVLLGTKWRPVCQFHLDLKRDTYVLEGMES